MHIPYSTYYAFDTTPEKGAIDKALLPNFETGNGVYYEFKVEGSKSMNSQPFNIYDNFTITADYYLVATDSTSVQPIYVHNYSPFIDSVSISFGPIGTSISTDNFTSKMEGKPLSLKGYNNRTELQIVKLNPADYGFESQYYFYDKKKDINTEFGNITSSRLRCGYIEESTINLSPNRKNAGEAYLKLYFDSYVYELETNLSLWGKSENLLYQLGDRSIIQYLDSSGNWIDCYDILANNISTDRKNPDTISVNIPVFTKAIRFYAKKNNPTSDWNRGRLCIGETTYYTARIK